MKNAHNEALIKAQACTTAEEAKALFEKHVSGSKFRWYLMQVGNVYAARWVQLANKEAEEKAKACTTPEEAEALYDDAPYGSAAEQMYLARLNELTN